MRSFDCRFGITDVTLSQCCQSDATASAASIFSQYYRARPMSIPKHRVKPAFARPALPKKSAATEVHLPGYTVLLSFLGAGFRPGRQLS